MMWYRETAMEARGKVEGFDPVQVRIGGLWEFYQKTDVFCS